MKSRSFTKEREKILRGLELAYQRLIEFKKRKHSPIIVSRGGKILELDPENVLPTSVK
jgi:hypothetical protein